MEDSLPEGINELAIESVSRCKPPIPISKKMGKAQVMRRDDSSGGWLPVKGGGLSWVGLFLDGTSYQLEDKIGRASDRLSPALNFCPTATSTGSLSNLYDPKTLEDVIGGKPVILGQRITDNTIILNCPIDEHIQYIRVNPIFHHWKTGNDFRCGLTFQSPGQAAIFEKGLLTILEKLKNDKNQNNSDILSPINLKRTDQCTPLYSSTLSNSNQNASEALFSDISTYISPTRHRRYLGTIKSSYDRISSPYSCNIQNLSSGKSDYQSHHKSIIGGYNLNMLNASIKLPLKTHLSSPMPFPSSPTVLDHKSNQPPDGNSTLNLISGLEENHIFDNHSSINRDNYCCSAQVADCISSIYSPHPIETYASPLISSLILSIHNKEGIENTSVYSADDPPFEKKYNSPPTNKMSEDPSFSKSKTDHNYENSFGNMFLSFVPRYFIRRAAPPLTPRDTRKYFRKKYDVGEKSNDEASIRKASNQQSARQFIETITCIHYARCMLYTINNNEINSDSEYSDTLLDPCSCSCFISNDTEDEYEETDNQMENGCSAVKTNKYEFYSPGAFIRRWLYLAVMSIFFPCICLYPLLRCCLHRFNTNSPNDIDSENYGHAATTKSVFNKSPANIV
ncbi:unnamed protein product [Gordionus sp. m RMFG-2023]